VTDVAKLAGVSRMTVYNHFPTDTELFTACSAHWASQNPFPDPSGWTTIPDPEGRLVTGLGELYGWYRLKQGMLSMVLRDTAVLESLGEVMDRLWLPYLESLVEVLASGWSAGSCETDEPRAMLRLAVDFNTWRVLTGSGLDDDGAARLMVGTVACLASTAEE
jgi:AcrR family transcriptional regulator